MHGPRDRKPNTQRVPAARKADVPPLMGGPAGDPQTKPHRKTPGPGAMEQYRIGEPVENLGRAMIDRSTEIGEQGSAHKRPPMAIDSDPVAVEREFETSIGAEKIGKAPCRERVCQYV